MISRYGLDNFFIILAIGLIFLVCIYFVKWSIALSSLFFLIGLFLITVAFWFFRDPKREIPDFALKNPAVVLSPADGTIMEIVDDNEDNYMKSKSKRISIFLSVLDVHVNRVPTSGVIEFVKFIPGRKLIASDNKASQENQQSLFGLRNPYGKILFKQIVGVLARRIVWDIKVSDSVIVGEKFGMMKFGSRMDIHLPENSETMVRVGQKVVAGQTQLALLKQLSAGN